MKKFDLRPVPVRILDIILPILKEESDACCLDAVGKDGNGYLMVIKDNVPNSSCSFRLMKPQDPNSGNYLHLLRSPLNETYAIDGAWGRVEINDLGPNFKNWITLIKKYKTLEEEFFYDPFIANAQDEFFTIFEFVDDVEKNKPLSLPLLILFDSHLNFLTERIGYYLNDDNKMEMEAIAVDIEIARTQLTKETHLKILRTIANIYAKITKSAGVKFLIDLSKDALKTKLKELILSPDKAMKFLTDITDIAHTLVK